MVTKMNPSPALHIIPILIIIQLISCQSPSSKEALDRDQFKGIQYLSDQSQTSVIKDYAHISFRSDAYEVLLDATPSRGDLLCEFGDLMGTACLANGLDLRGASVKLETLDCNNEPLILTTESNHTGTFFFQNIPTGPGRLTIELGRYSGTFPVQIDADRVNAPSTTGSTKICLVPMENRMAVTTGLFDQVEVILDELSMDYDLFCGLPDHYRPSVSLISDMNQLNLYKILLVNCGSGIDLSHAQNINKIENIKEFVRNGGSVYFSDLALSVLNRIWPSMVIGDYQERNKEYSACCDCAENQCSDECIKENSTINSSNLDMSMADASMSADTNRCESFNTLVDECKNRYGILATGRRGEVQAKISNDNLKTAVGFEDLPILFDLGGWVKITRVAESVEVLVAQKGNDSEGVFERPLMVRFKPYPNGGWVAYTSFHYHPQLSMEVKAILSSLILRL